MMIPNDETHVKGIETTNQFLYVWDVLIACVSEPPISYF